MFFPGPVLAIETSCDETAAAVVVDGKIRSSIIASQIDLHQKWGGVVPEAAARAHIHALLPVVEEALGAARVTIEDVEGIAVTNRPGLVGALSVGVSAAKALALANSIPLVGIHHLEGHLCSIFSVIAHNPFPYLALIVSGGHTELVLADDFGCYRIIGETIDDAAGEAFDKGARVMGLPYPGGRSIQEAAMTGNPIRYPLPTGLADKSLNFSFSGLKTAVLRLVEQNAETLSIPDAAACLQSVIVKVLVQKSMRACVDHRVKTLALVGGVAANVRLRDGLGEECERNGIEFLTPPLELCTDNAAMIGLAGSIRLARGQDHGIGLGVFPNQDLDKILGETPG